MFERNKVSIVGTVKQIRSHHTYKDHEIFEMTVGVRRLSGTVDEVVCRLPSRMLDGSIFSGKRVQIKGFYRSANETINGKSRLILFVDIEEITLTDRTDDENFIQIKGAYICKPSIFRETPFGKQITDMLIAYCDDRKRSSYFPCIAWGTLANFARDFNVGQSINLIGRLQSRQYQKTTPEGTEYRIAYEISINNLELCN